MDTPCQRPILKKGFLFMCFTGLRVGDLIQLRWEHLLEDAQGDLYISKVIQKTKRDIELYLSPEAIACLPEKKFDQVFFGFKNGTIQGEWLRAWAKDAGINHKIRFHSARHTFAMLHLHTGEPLPVIKELMGHQSISSTEIYATIYDQTLKKAGRKSLI